MRITCVKPHRASLRDAVPADSNSMKTALQLCVSAVCFSPAGFVRRSAQSLVRKCTSYPHICNRFSIVLRFFNFLLDSIVQGQNRFAFISELMQRSCGETQREDLRSQVRQFFAAEDLTGDHNNRREFNFPPADASRIRRGVRCGLVKQFVAQAVNLRAQLMVFANKQGYFPTGVQNAGMVAVEQLAD